MFFTSKLTFVFCCNGTESKQNLLKASISRSASSISSQSMSFGAKMLSANEWEIILQSGLRLVQITRGSLIHQWKVKLLHWIWLSLGPSTDLMLPPCKLIWEMIRNDQRVDNWFSPFPVTLQRPYQIVIMSRTTHYLCDSRTAPWIGLTYKV